MTASPAQRGRLELFTIRGLHGHRTVEATLSNNTLIIVGENGSGKTTFLRILVHFLTGGWQQLLNFKFASVKARISGQEFTLTREELEAAAHPRFESEMARRHYMARLAELESLGLGRSQAERNMLESEMVELQSRSRGEIEKTRREAYKIAKKMGEIQEALGAQVVYLPTYRRIERELTSILPELEEMRRHRGRRSEETSGPVVELVEFGMGDVEKALAKALGEMKDLAREGLNTLTLRYLSDVVRGTYNTVDFQTSQEMSPDSVQAVLSRIGEAVLSAPEKDHVREVILNARGSGSLTEHEKIIHHYFSKLREFQENLQARERNIAEFAKLCNTYIKDKQFVYDGAKFSFDIHGPHGGIKLADLSSGEKQIVSLFSHLYLSENHVFFVIIDEPELSLSVPWQRTFLSDIRSGSFCAGLVAATHSPFIYENDLKQYTHSLGEFTRA